MQSSQEKSNADCQRDNDKSSDEPKKSLKLDDLNDFCLLKIIGRLDLQGLLNVVDTSKRLRSLALDVYKREFGAKTVSISGCAAIHANVGAGLAVQESIDSIQIRGLKKSLQYLRCFGPFIHGLSINYGDKKSKHYEHLHEYVNDFCAETLVGITFRNLPNIAIEQFQKLFVNIRDVSFEHCNLGKKWSSFVQWFANLHSLSFGDVRMVYRTIEKPFQNLEHLRIEGLDADGFTSIQVVADLLDGINQLKSLEIEYHEIEESNMSIAELLDLIKDNASISKLSVFVVYNRPTSAEIQRLINEHPALVELGLENCVITPDDAIAMIPQLDSLKWFKFHTQVNYFSNERSDFESRLDDCGWDLSVGDTGCCMRTFIYDMYVTLTRRA